MQVATYLEILWDMFSECNKREMREMNNGQVRVSSPSDSSIYVWNSSLFFTAIFNIHAYIYNML